MTSSLAVRAKMFPVATVSSVMACLATRVTGSPHVIVRFATPLLFLAAASTGRHRSVDRRTLDLGRTSSDVKGGLV